MIKPLYYRYILSYIFLNLSFIVPPANQQTPKSHEANQSSTTPVKTGGGAAAGPRRMRTFEEIVEQEKKNRNILTVKITKIVQLDPS